MAQWKSEESLVFWLAILLIVFLALVGALIFYTKIYLRNKMENAAKMADLRVDHQKELLKDSLSVQENERQRIASDLHDELISKLNVLMLSNFTEENKDSSKLLQDCIASARRISHDLSPPLLDENHFSEFVEDLISHFRTRFNVNYSVSDTDDTLISSENKLQLIRILQEILNNILKHAKATSIDVIVRIQKSYLALIIRDNGVGFDPTEKNKGLGMSNIEMRTQKLDGHFKLKSSKGNGTSYFFLFHT